MAQAEAKLTTKKRKTPSCQSATHRIFTRSKPQIYLHHNPRFESHTEKSFTDSNDMSMLVKDLRTRRVFSGPVNGSEKGTDSCFDKEDSVFKGNDLSEECVQATPPDADIFVEKNVVVQNHNTNARNKPVLNPCFRLKLFKTPGSFSYRRLLPYLKDITRDYICATEVSQCRKIDKGLEEKVEIDGCSVEGHTGNESNSVPMVHESIVNGEIEKFEMGISCKDQNSHMEDSHLNKDSSGGERCNAKELMDHGGTRKTDGGFSCNAQDFNSFDCNLSSTMEKCHSGKDGEGGRCSDDTKQPEIRGMEIFNAGDTCKAENLNCMNSSLADTEWHGKNGSVERRSNGDQIDDSNEECVQMAPPDSDIFGKPEADETEGVGVESVLQSSQHVLEKPLNGSVHRNSSCAGNKRFDSSSKSKLVLNRCSRPKLFKTPGSFSYRRLLPFLKDMAKDDYCASGNGFTPKLNSLEEKPPSPLLVSDCQKMSIENSSGSSCHTEHDTGDFSTLPIAISVAGQGLSNDKEESLMSPDHITESTMTFDSQQEREFQVEQNTADTGRKLEIVPDIVDSAHGSDPPAKSSCFFVSSGSFARENATLVSHQLPVNTQEDCTKPIIKFTDGAKPIDADGLLQEPSQLEASIHSGIPTVGSKKGILKRNPRGCRGACTCLNCSSFHIHAERAFEFSRNQMQDAEEVSLDLIKELSYLRNLLEKSAFGVDGHAVICINQVKEACRKASEAEELAKNRLDQMNYDLDIHCRIPSGQRPSVRFANYVQEKDIPKLDLPSKQSMAQKITILSTQS